MADNVEESKLILVTAANSYLASNIVTALVERGFRVRGTVRAFSRVENLLRGPWRDYGKRLELVEVPDICVPSAFDAAVKGAYAILHLAAPVIKPGITASELMVPTLEGTRNILQSALTKAGPQLETFVFTTSAGAFINPGQKTPHIYTSDSRNTIHERQAIEEGEHCSPYVAYPAAKVAAEKLVFHFRDQHKPSFAITSIGGSIATGPALLLPKSAKDLPLTLQSVYKAVAGLDEPGPQDAIGKIAGAAPYTDMRDIVRMYLWAIENAKDSDGQRYLVVAGCAPRQAIFDILREAYPERNHIIPKGTPGNGYQQDWRTSDLGVGFDGSKALDAMGGDWISYKQSILETAASLRPLWDN